MDDFLEKTPPTQNQPFPASGGGFTPDLSNVENTVAQNKKLRPLGQEFSLERNFSKLPICAPHSRVANKIIEIEYSPTVLDGKPCIPKITIEPLDGSLLPLQQHAKVLDVLLAIFARNFNENGELWFTYQEIATILEITAKDTTAIKEAIIRYNKTIITFEKKWLHISGTRSDVFAIIESTDLTDIYKKNKNPGRSTNKDDLHYVKFNQNVVKNIKDNLTRLFPTQALAELDAGTYALYKIFYGPTDKAPVMRSIDYVAKLLGWTSHITKLRHWLAKHFEILREKNYILWWRVCDDNYEVQASALENRRNLLNIGKTSPLTAEKMKAGMVIKTREKAKLKSISADQETEKAIFKQRNGKPKKPSRHENSKKLSRAQRVLEELSKLDKNERTALLSLLSKST